jgi:hypothetical protein
MVSTSLANAPLVFIWLALARTAECEMNALRMRYFGVLGLQESPHGNLGRELNVRKGNNVRDRLRAMEHLQSHGPKAFLRRFKINRPMFDDIVEKSRPIVEADDVGKEHARRSRGSHVLA